LRAVAATLSILVAALMLAQPALAGKTADMVSVSDVSGDLNKLYLYNGKTAPWPDNSPIGQADYLDIKEVSISKQKGTFVLTMTMYCDDLLADVALTPGTNAMGWVHFLDTNLDGSSDFMLCVAWYGNGFESCLTVLGPTPIDLEPPRMSIAGATFTQYVDADMIGNPSSIASTFCVIVDFSPHWQNIYGGVFWVDISDSFEPLVWPA